MKTPTPRGPRSWRRRRSSPSPGSPRSARSSTTRRSSRNRPRRSSPRTAPIRRPSAAGSSCSSSAPRCSPPIGILPRPPRRRLRESVDRGARHRGGRGTGRSACHGGSSLVPHVGTDTFRAAAHLARRGARRDHRLRARRPRSRSSSCGPSWHRDGSGSWATPPPHSSRPASSIPIVEGPASRTSPATCCGACGSSR